MGVGLIKDGYGILTHCNAGALATGDYGTALSPIYLAVEKGMKITVYSDENQTVIAGVKINCMGIKKSWR